MPKKIIVVTKKTSYSKYIQDQDDEASKALIHSSNPAVAFWRSSHDNHMKTLDLVVNEIQKQNIVCTVIDSKLFVADPDDVEMVITVGGDGTLLSASHNVSGSLPILGVNSDPDNSVGFFCYATSQTFLDHLMLALDNFCIKTELTRMSVIKNGKPVSNRILNDVLLCHTNPAATSKYIMQLMNRSTRTMIAVDGMALTNTLGKDIKIPARPSSTQETQRSSGIWVGPAAGSTAARRSAGASHMDLTSNDLQLRVRELYYRPSSIPGLQEMIAKPGQFIKVISKMDSAAMYLDGDYSVVPVGLGDEINFEKSEEPLFLLGKSNVFCG